jgi:hypothetical protein
MSLIQRIKKQEIFTRKTTLIGSVIMLLLLTACGPSTAPEPAPAEEPAADPLQPAAEVEESTGEEAYPPPVVEIPAAEAAYPVAPPPTPLPPTVPDSYPAAEEVFAEPRFRLDLPLQAGATTVSGQAPPDLALAVADVTYNGVILGTGVSDADGRFVIGVQALPEGNRVGITFAELQPGKTLTDMSFEYFPHRGEGFMNLPNVGIYFDTAMVEP